MQKVKISFRLATLIEQSKQLNTSIKSIADIGTDHGYLPFKMFENGLIDKSILCDINKGPLENAKQTFEKSDFINQVDFRLGSGIEPLIPGEVDLVFIAGMGGGLILDILSKDLSKSLSFPYLILQPMTEQNLLRTWLINNGFEVLWDHFIEDANKQYEIIVVQPIRLVNHNYSTLEIPGNDPEFGIRILPSQIKTFVNFIDFKSKKYEMIQSRIENEGNSERSDKRDLCKKKLETIQTIYKVIKPKL